jgi:hypothetical protein
MSTLLYAQMRHPIPADENTVRSTTAPVEPDAPPAEAKGAPEWNEVETDPNPHLGMATRQVASDWHQPEKYAPGWAAYANPTDSATIINQQVDSSGTAAARELAGQQGHGTYAYAVGIEPVVRDGASFGADYFEAAQRGAQEDIPDQMSRPFGVDRDDVSAVAYAAKVNARDATAASVYAAWYARVTG